MDKRSRTPAGKPPRERYTLSEDAYETLCLVRDELRLFASIAARRSKGNPDVVIGRNRLAYCFDYLAQRVEGAVSRIGDTLAKKTSDRSAEGKLHKD